MSTPLNFGNGIVAHFEGLPGLANDGVGRIEKGHYGFRTPTVEISATEHGIGDGGSYGSSRAATRKLRCTVSHPAIWTPREIVQAFTPGVLRTLTTDLGTLPYYVEDLEFPESMREAKYRFAVTMWSPLAYPLGALQEVLASSIYDYTDHAYTTGAEKNDVLAFSGYLATIAQTLEVDSGDKLSAAGFKVKYNYKLGPTSVTVEVYRYESTMSEAELIASRTYTYGEDAFTPESPYVGHTRVALDELAGADSNYFVKMTYDTRYLTPYTDTAAGCTTGVGYFYYLGAWIAGDSDDSTTDWAHVYTTGTPDTETTTVYLDPQTDVECYPAVTITLAEDTEELTVTDGTLTTTITASLEIDDVVVIDSANRTITVNDVDAIAGFDRDGDWPLLYPDSGYLESSSPGAIGVEWQPRLMGLI